MHSIKWSISNCLGVFSYYHNFEIFYFKPPLVLVTLYEIFYFTPLFCLESQHSIFLLIVKTKILKPLNLMQCKQSKNLYF